MNKKRIKVGVIGATGYAGIELVRMLLQHPNVELKAISSVSFHGQDISSIYPNLRGSCEMELKEGYGSMLKNIDVIFASLPHGLSQEIAEKCADSVFIDLGADFRLDSEEEYMKWYGGKFLDKQLQSKAVYGLPELFRKDIKKARLIANPGCYPTSVGLALYPALKYDLVKTSGIIIDSKSGTTGAGRSLTQNTHFPECNEAFSAYKAGEHRHRPEIEQILGKIKGSEIKVTFTPHLLPINRGILSTIYCEMKTDLAKIRGVYEEIYREEPFVQVLRAGEYANTKNVRLSNCCHISLHEDRHTNRLILCSAIDNMVKGAAGQAIQNMNIIFNLKEKCGLTAVAPAF